MFDIVIIGGGVVGALTARELSRYNLKICLLEQSGDVASGATSANSGIVHAGFDAPIGTLKAKHNLLGNKLMKKLTDDLGVKFKNNNSLVVGFDDNDKNTLNQLLQRGKTNGVENLKIIEHDELVALEPNISDGAKFALQAKTGSIVCPYELAIAAVGNAMDNGISLKLNFKVTAILEQNDRFTVISEKNDKVETRVVINCAGIYADKIAAMIKDTSFKINARKGEYILLDRESGGFVNSTLFACPNEKGKGVLISPTVDNNIIIGPTSVESKDKEDNSIFPDGFEFIISNAKRLTKNIPLFSTITSFCGIRAYSNRHDFIIEKSKINSKFINVAGIESPGLTAAPSIALTACELALSELNSHKQKSNFNPKRTPDFFFKNLTKKEKNELIKKDPTYGKIVCRCEEITLGEILFSLRRNPIPKTVDSIKRRTRAGMGRCQGGFCQPSVAKILKDEFNLSYEEITKSGGNSYIFTGKTK